MPGAAGPPVATHPLRPQRVVPCASPAAGSLRRGRATPSRAYCRAGDTRARVAVSSAGFVGGGRPSPPAAVAEAAGREVDLRAHVSRLVLAPLLGPATLVVVMEPRQRRALLARFGVAPGRVLVLGDLDP